MSRKPTFNDLKDGMNAMKHYKINNLREVEKVIRKHYDGASDRELKKAYNEFFKKEK